MFKRDLGKMRLTLSLNGHSTEVWVKNIEVHSRRVNLANLPQSEINELIYGVKDAILKRAADCLTTASVRSHFLRSSPVVQEGVWWHASLATIEPIHFRRITKVPSEPQVLRPMTDDVRRTF